MARLKAHPLNRFAYTGTTLPNRVRPLADQLCQPNSSLESLSALLVEFADGMSQDISATRQNDVDAALITFLARVKALRNNLQGRYPNCDVTADRVGQAAFRLHCRPTFLSQPSTLQLVATQYPGLVWEHLSELVPYTQTVWPQQQYAHYFLRQNLDTLADDFEAKKQELDCDFEDELFRHLDRNQQNQALVLEWLETAATHSLTPRQLRCQLNERSPQRRFASRNP